MRKEFLIDVKPPEFYNYISGRIKVLENGLLSREVVERISSGKTLHDVKAALSETPYKAFLSGDTFSELTESIFSRFDSELTEMEKFVSPGFINSFFREKTIFLKIKRWALISIGEESELFTALYKFVNGGSGEFPLVFRDVYSEMVLRKENPLEVGILLDIYRIKFLIDSAHLTKSQLIENYYDAYAKKCLREILVRLLGFVGSSLVDDASLKQTLEKLGSLLAEYPLAKRLLSVKDKDGFVDFVKGEVLSIDNTIFETEISKILETGRFMNVGIEVVFVYLKRLQKEVTELAMILSGKGNGISGREILGKVSANYE